MLKRRENRKIRVFSINELCKYFDISYKTFYRRLKEYNQQGNEYNANNTYSTLLFITWLIHHKKNTKRQTT